MPQLYYLLKLKEEELKREVYHYLEQKKMNPIYEDGFVYAEGQIPILLVAHMDTVFAEPPQELYYNKHLDMIYSCNGGIGGDDRCGVYAVLKLLEKYKPYILFTQGEEIGCVGAYKAVVQLNKPNVKYIIEFDRKGSNDCVFYDCGNQEFMDYIESFDFVTNYGTCSDISVLGSVWDIASVNLSSGYYHEHTENEYIIFHELIHNINRVKKMLKDWKNVPYFNYQEIQHTPSFFDGTFKKNEALVWWIVQNEKNLHPLDQSTDKKLNLKFVNQKNKGD